MALTKERFLAGLATLPREEVAIPELNDSVWVWGLSGIERDAFEASMTTMRKGKREQNLVNIRARFLVLVLRDADGQRLFSDGEAGAVGNLPATVLDRLFDVGRRLSGMTEQDVEELGKVSGIVPPGPSPSDSRGNSAA